MRCGPRGKRVASQRQPSRAREQGTIMSMWHHRSVRTALGIGVLLANLAVCPLTTSVSPPPPASPTGISLATPLPPTATAAPTRTPIPTSSLDQRIDAYIARLTPAQQIGQTLMLAVY